jgi:hypothetical protein
LPPLLSHESNIFTKVGGRRSSPRFQFGGQGTHSHQDIDYSADGVVRGVTNHENDQVLRCGIVCQSWPTWAYALSHCSFKLDWILVVDGNLFDDINLTFPKVNILSYLHDHLSDIPSVDLVCFNGPMAGLSVPSSFGTLALFDWKFRNRKHWFDWEFNHSSISHLDCGGVSDYTGYITLGVHGSIKDNFASPAPPFHSSYPKCNLSSLIKCTVQGRHLSSDPGLPKAAKNTIAHSLGRNLYHYKALYPFGNWKAEFFTPCVFARKPAKLTRRPLSIDELREVLDIPSNGLRPTSITRLLPTITTPVKVLSAVLSRCFLDTGGVDASFSHGSSASNVTEIASVAPQAEVANSNTGAWVTHSIKESIDIATKADDARIPIELWNSCLEKKLNISLSQSQSSALEVIREWSVAVIWKRKLTKCFCRWLRCRKCHDKRLDLLFDSRTNKSKLWFNCAECSRFNKNCEVMKIGDKYVWKAKGKLAYKKWFNVYTQKHKASRTDILKSRLAAVDCMERASVATAWEWSNGSRPHFWRWGKAYWMEARDGAKVAVCDKLPNFRKRQDLPKDKNTKTLIQGKVNKVRKRGYIKGGRVASVTSFFAVPKGDDDIRMVYNGTSCGLNDAVFAPWFALPTMDSHLRAVDIGTYMADCDIGEMFLNFMLDEKLREYAGVDLTDLFPDESSGETFWERWERLLMGFKPSPYLTTRSMRRIENFLKGKMDDPGNVFRWASVVLNLPGSSDYNPGKPWVYKIRLEGTMAGDLFIYIDDLRPTCPSEEECWAGSHQIGSRLTWLGIQDAPRKKRKASQRPGAWAGSVIHTDNDMVTILVSDSKWTKTKRLIRNLSEQLEKGNLLNHKELEKTRGFLIYVSRTYKPFVPYLRGVHKTIDSWRPHRDSDGWKLTQSEIEAAMEEDDEYVFRESQKMSAGDQVKAVPRLKSDIAALMKLTESPTPPKVVKRRKVSASACYGFGDASGKGFGNALVINGTIYSEYGTWNAKLESKHSNYKELRNLVNSVLSAYEGGRLKNAELFLFTDNFVAECAFYNGGSNVNKDLNELVFMLWKLQMEGDFTLHVYHVAGTRMIESGIDGLSRGDKLEGIAKGERINNFIPIHLDPLERSPKLLDWVYSWWDEGYGKLKIMKPCDWFKDSMLGGNFLWNIPPAAGQVAVEQFCTHIHGRPDTMHILLIPRLCTSLWRKQLMKAADIILTIKPEEDFWSKEMHEPLLTAIYFPILPSDYRFRPWQLKGTELVDRCIRKVSGMRKGGHAVEWDCLRELLASARKIPSMPDGMARKMLRTSRGR